MTDDRPVVGLVASAVGGVETIRKAFVGPAQERGWRVAVTLTPTAGTWLAESGELAELEATTGLTVRVDPRKPGE